MYAVSKFKSFKVAIDKCPYADYTIEIVVNKF